MMQLTKSRVTTGAMLLTAVMLCACEGESRPFLEAAEIQSLVVTSLRVVPPKNEDADSIRINPGQTLQMSVTGTTDTGTAVDITGAGRAWTSSDSQIVSVNENGTITGIADGFATVAVAIGDYSANLPITVRNATLDRIGEWEGRDAIDPCLPAEYYAKGLFSDGIERPLYDANYFIDDNSTEFLPLTEDFRVKLVGVVPETRLRLNVVAANGVTGFEEFSILNTLVAESLNITPTNITVREDQTIDLTASAIYNSTALVAPSAPGESGTTLPNSAEPVTDGVEWTITQGSGFARVDNDGANKGRVTGLSVGTAQVQVSCGEILSAAQEITVLEAASNTSDKLSFDLAGLNGGRVKIPSDRSLILRVARGTTYDADEAITSNLVFKTTPGTATLAEEVIDLKRLNDRTDNQYLIDPLDGSESKQTQIQVELVEDNVVIASGNIFIEITVPDP